jgi:hypothetical protein
MVHAAAQRPHRLPVRGRLKQTAEVYSEREKMQRENASCFRGQVPAPPLRCLLAVFSEGSSGFYSEEPLRFLPRSLGILL